MLPERFAVGLTPLPTAARVARQRSALRMRIISALVSLALLAGLLVFFNPGWSTGVIVAFVVIWLSTSAAWITLTAIALNRAKRDLGSISNGDALYIDASGIEFVYPEPIQARWSDISALRVAGGSLGAGPRLDLEVSGQRLTGIPLSFLDATPSAIDSATSAHSLGRVRVDVSGLDKMF